MVDYLSAKFTSVIRNHVDGISEEKAEVINYSLSIIINEAILNIIVFSLAAVFGLIKYALLFVIIFGALRVSAGGSHGRSRLECHLIYLTSLFGSVLLAKYYQPIGFYSGLFILCIELVIILMYAPGDTIEKPIRSRKFKARQRVISIILLVLVSVLSFTVWSFDKIIYNILILSTIFPAFLLTPFGYFLLRCKRSCDASPEAGCASQGITDERGDLHA